MKKHIQDQTINEHLPGSRKEQETTQIDTTPSPAPPRSATTTQTEITLRHTPGPYVYWREEDGCDDYWRIGTKADHHILATITFWDDDPAETAESEANARLFAAAPRLLETLRRLLDAVGGLPTASLDVPFYEAEYNARMLIMQLNEQD